MAVQWSLVLFTALAGAGAWLLACALVGELKDASDKLGRWTAVSALVLLVGGGLCSVAHLSHPERILAALAHPAPGIFLEALLLGIDAVVAALYGILVARKAAPGVRKGVAAVAVLMALAFTLSTGSSYVMASQLAWNTATLPLAYVGTAAATGTAFYLVLCAVLKEEPVVNGAAMLALGGGIAALGLGLAYGLVGDVAFNGNYAAVFWLTVVLCGGIAPAICGLLALKSPASPLACGSVAAAGSLVGSIGLRAIMWMAGSGLMTLFGVAI